MFERFSRSWQLVKASGSVLMQDKELLLFPLISSVAAFIVLMCFALPLWLCRNRRSIARPRRRARLVCCRVSVLSHPVLRHLLL